MVTKAFGLLIEAGNALALEIETIGCDAAAASGDPADGDRYTALARTWREALGLVRAAVSTAPMDLSDPRD